MPELPVPTPDSTQQPGGTSTPRKPVPYVVPPEEKKLVQRVTERINFSTSETTRWELERQMFENIAFMCGVQWLEYSKSTRRFSRWNAPTWFPTPQTNYIAPRVTTMQSGLLRSQPQGRVRPQSTDSEDAQAAKDGELFIGHLYDMTNEDQLREEAALIACLTGTAVAEDYFNPNAGPIYEVPKTNFVEKPVTEPSASCPSCGHQAEAMDVGVPCPVCQTPLEAGERPRTYPDGSPMMQGAEEPELGEDGQPVVDTFHEGEVQSRVRLLMNFYWDKKATKLEDARWCGEAFYADLDWIDEQFPEKGKYVGQEEGIDTMGFYEASLLGLIGPSMDAASYGGHSYFRHGAVVRKYQEKPSQQFPNGLHLIVAGNVVLWPPDLTQVSLPLKDKDGEVVSQFSYTEFRFDPVPGRFPGRTPMDDMVPLQKRVNGIDAQVILNRKTLVNPWILAPKGSGLDPEKIHMRPGATVLYNFVGVGAAPQVVQGTALPAQVLEERSQCIQAMDMLIQDSAALAQQSVPQGMRSGVAMNFAKEAREEVTIPRLKRWGSWVAKRDRKRLLLVQQHYREERAVRVLGSGSEWRVRMLKGADLLGNTDVVVDPGTLLPRSQSMRQQAVYDALEVGLIAADDPVSKQKLIEIMLGPDVFETEAGPDRRRALKENAAMDSGEAKEINDFDNHDVHVLTHVTRMKDPSYDDLPPEIQALHKDHMDKHNQAKSQAADQAKQQQMQELEEKLKLAERAKMLGVPMGNPLAGNGAAPAQQGAPQ